MDKLMVEFGAATVEMAAWAAVATMAPEMRRTAELALAADGPDGLDDLAAVGPALGGLSEAQLGELVAAMGAELEAEATAWLR